MKIERTLIQSLKNFSALAFVQFTNYLLPLLTIPYLIRVLGLELFGLVSTAQAILIYFVVITDYGFNLTSTQEVSRVQHDKDKLNRIVSCTFATKVILLLISFCIFYGLTLFVPYLAYHQALFFLGFSVVLGQAFFPMWFFQGIEKLQFVAYLNLISRILLTGLIFIFVDAKSDYILVIPIYSIAAIISSLIAIYLMINRFGVKLIWPKGSEIVQSLSTGFNLFVGSLASNISVNSGIILLGMFSTPVSVGLFAVVDKIMLIFRQMMTVFGQAIYPTLCKLKIEDEARIPILIKSLQNWGGLAVLSGSILLAAWPDLLLIILVGEVNEELKILIRVVSIAPIFLFGSTLLNQVLLVYGYRTLSSVSYILSSILGLLVYYFLIHEAKQLGAVYATIIVEAIIFFILLFFSIRVKLIHWFK